MSDPAPDARLARSAIRRLSQNSVRVSQVDLAIAGSPGLYALYASAQTWRELGLGSPPDQRPLYVGKAQDTLAARDLRGHFGIRDRKKQSPTGNSTVRRSLAALLASSRGYRGMPRNPLKPSHFANYGLAEPDDEDLSAWMRRRLRIALWPHDTALELGDLETAVLRHWRPPLNLDKIDTPWRPHVMAARSVLKQQAEQRSARTK
jgi:hypothetical protein